MIPTISNIYKKNHISMTVKAAQSLFENSMKIHYNLYGNFKSEKFYQHCIKSSSKI